MNTLSPAGVFLSRVGCKLIPTLQHHRRGHAALPAQLMPQAAPTWPAQPDLCIEPPAALPQLANAPTGKVMPYHKAAIKTGLSLDGPVWTSSPAARLVAAFWVCGAVCWHAAGRSESRQAAAPIFICGNSDTGSSSPRRAGSWRCWEPAAEPLSLGGCCFSSPGRWKLSRVRGCRLHPHRRHAAAEPDGSQALEELRGAELLWKTGCGPGCWVLLEKHWLRVYD